MKRRFGIIATIVAGAFFLFAPARASRENPIALDGIGSSPQVAVQILGPGSWVRTLGEPGNCAVNQVLVDRDGKMYFAGNFKGSLDFDPGPGVDEHVSNGDFDFFVAKFDQSGKLLWARTWGGSESEFHLNVALDGVGGVYLAGDFAGSIDFDPGATVAQGVSNGETDVFLSKFDTDGNFNWVRTWGGEPYEFAGGVAADSSQVFVAGSFGGTVDFDPGPGVATAVIETKWLGVFLSKFNPSGDFQWVRAWGGNAMPGDWCEDVCVGGNGDVYVSGAFSGTVDFDPGDGTDQHISNGGWDIFLSKFDSGGGFQWARTWGGYYDDFGGNTAVENNGYVHVAGTCSTIGRNFDSPGVGNGLDQPSSEGASHACLATFDSSGNLRWSREWGGLGMQFCNDLAIDASGGIYVSGIYQVVGGLDLKTGGAGANGRFASSVVKFDSMGRFRRCYTFGDIYGENGLHLAVDSSGGVIMAGSVSETGDFDKRLLAGDYMGSADPGAFLIRLVE